jgi:hypothetical protein
MSPALICSRPKLLPERFYLSGETLAHLPLLFAFLASIIVHLVVFSVGEAGREKGRPALHSTHLPIGVSFTSLPRTTQVDRTPPRQQTRLAPVSSVVPEAAAEAEEAKPGEAEVAGVTLPEEKYYRQDELTVPAIPLISPVFTSANEFETTGYFELTLLIGEDGTVDAIVAGDSTLPSDFVEHLKEDFSKMTFRPGMIDGRRVKTRFEVRAEATFAPQILEVKSLPP